jgi:ubiquinone/menaquinone biosynthesis C-methylase UbiE
VKLSLIPNELGRQWKWTRGEGKIVRPRREEIEGNREQLRLVRDFWNSEACGERYGSDQDRKRYELEPEIVEFARFPDAAGKRVLEIGVGMGSDFRRWAEAGADTFGTDLTDRAIELTGRRLRGSSLRGLLTISNAEELPFADESFDLVYSWGVLHHTPHTRRAIQEVRRVLRRGGSAKLMLYHRRSWLALAAWVRFGPLRGRLFLSLRQAIANMESPGTQAFTRSEVEEMLNGFDSLMVRPRLTHWDRKWWPLIARLTGNRFGWFLLVEASKLEPLDGRP